MDNDIKPIQPGAAYSDLKVLKPGEAYSDLKPMNANPIPQGDHHEQQQ